MKRSRRYTGLLIIAATSTLGTVVVSGGVGFAKAHTTSQEKYSPPITLTTVATTTPTVTFAKGDSVNNNPWTRAILAKYGIKVNTLWTVDQSQWQTKTNLMISSGNLPSFFLANPTQFQQLVDAGLIADLTTAYKKDAPADVKQVLNEGGPDALKSATINGKLMAIPFTGVPKEGASVLWVRTDWLKKLHLSPPKTMADVLNIAKAFTTKDPDGDGKNDTYGLALDKDFSMLPGFLNGYHAYLDIWLKNKSGTLTYSSTQFQIRQALQALQTMYKDGEIDPTFGNQDITQVAQSIASGKIGMFYSSAYSGLWPLQSSHDNDPKAQWQAYALPSVDSHPALAQHGLGTYGYWVVNKNEPHPEALFKLLDFWIQTFYLNKSDAVFHQFVNPPNSSNEIWQLAPAKTYRAFKNADERTHVVAAMTGKMKVSDLTPDERNVYQNIQAYLKGNQSDWGWERIFGPTGSMGVISQYVKNNQYQADQFLGTATPTMVTKGQTLTSLEDQTFTNVIKGAPISQFDQFTQQWQKLGGGQITQEVNSWKLSNK